ncbi:MAG: S-adenosyl-l-methionine hydroxide adenosyltransferase [Dehalococcoidia bacterium]|nr:S-adenosyl-l-methionine hydroxide adenosyltransferase [Dehalococcoidia bacterium]
MSGTVITLLTDFGLADAYVGAMKGVILGVNPGATLIDLTHDVSPQDVLQGAFLLSTAWRYFPAGTIHVAVVDPGVGTERRALLLEAHGHLFLAPDNGLLSFILPPEDADAPLYQPYRASLPQGYRAYALTSSRYWRHPVSATFHGRDIFAPMAGHLSLGVAPKDVGDPVDSLIRLVIPVPSWRDGQLVGYVLHIDRFGNVVTTVPEAALVGHDDVVVEIAGATVRGLVHTYAEANGLAALIGSHGYLEFALTNGNAAKLLGVKVGDEVKVKVREK